VHTHATIKYGTAPILVIDGGCVAALNSKAQKSFEVTKMLEKEAKSRLERLKMIQKGPINKLEVTRTLKNKLRRKSSFRGYGQCLSSRMKKSRRSYRS
jgi:hypothetical protein